MASFLDELRNVDYTPQNVPKQPNYSAVERRVQELVSILKESFIEIARVKRHLSRFYWIKAVISNNGFSLDIDREGSLASNSGFTLYGSSKELDLFFSRLADLCRENGIRIRINGGSNMFTELLWKGVPPTPFVMREAALSWAEVRPRFEFFINL